MKKTTQKFLTLILALGAAVTLHAQEKNSEGPTAFGKRVMSVHPTSGVIKCATNEYEAMLQQKDPKRKTRAEFEAWLQPLVENYKRMQTVSSQSGGIITIPVVVHVIHSGQAVGVAPNITDAQVQSQITVLNNDYRKLAGTPGFNTNPVGADVMIQFALAKADPNGNPTNGVNHVNLCQASWSESGIENIVKPQTIWNPELYLNMWSVNFTSQQLLGYAQFPSTSGLPGFNSNMGGATTDGVVSGYRFFGSSDYNDGTFLLSAPFDKGRTMTHEVGHWLGLLHIWGDGDCSVDDYCADTPNADGEHYGCEIGSDTCPEAGLDMVQNYMDYSDDTCMNIFTVDQKARIQTVMTNSIRRSTLVTSTKDLAIPLFANDAEIVLERNCNSGGLCGATAATTKKVSLYNRGTSNLTTATLSYTVNGGTASTYTWTGNLAPNKYATFDVPVTATTSGPMVITIVNVNGVADQRASNNSATGEFSTGGPVNAPYTTVLFSLQRDYYGSETTWTLKNAAGTTLYSGGPYTDTPTSGPLPAPNTQTWTLPANGCYTFKINDSESDGICCDYGNGGYTIKSSPIQGSVTILSGGTFGATESKSFTTNSLSTGEFASSSAIYVYPNPAKTSLNIAFPSDLGLPDSYEIVNYLGQRVSSKKVATENDLSIDTSALSSGVYLISVSKDNQKKTMRFIKE